MKKIIILSTDSLHHRYFINSILDSDLPIDFCLFETTEAKPSFPLGPFFDKEEYEFERKNFFKEISPELDIKHFYVETVNNKISIEKIKNARPDLGILFGTRRVSSDLISLFKDGLVNVHRGISQEYRGLDSALWAVYNDDFDNIGVTIHKVDNALDTGEIVRQEKLKLTPDMKIYELRYYTTIIATRLVTDVMRDYYDGRLISCPQPKRGMYYSFMPLEMKRMTGKKFDEFSEKLHE